jgi:hypothetical protein
MNGYDSPSLRFRMDQDQVVPFLPIVDESGTY